MCVLRAGTVLPCWSIVEFALAEGLEAGSLSIVRTQGQSESVLGDLLVPGLKGAKSEIRVSVDGAGNLEAAVEITEEDAAKQTVAKLCANHSA